MLIIYQKKQQRIRQLSNKLLALGLYLNHFDDNIFTEAIYVGF